MIRFINNLGENSSPNYPFGKELPAERNTYLTIWDKARKKHYPIVDRFEKESGFSIDKKWFHELALHTQVVLKESEICYQHGRLLYTVLSNYLQRNNISLVNILETGTARGFSSLCMAKVLYDQNIKGKIITIDPLPHKVRMLWNCIDDLEGEKTRKELLTNYSDLTSRYILFLEGKSQNIFDRNWRSCLKLIPISPRAIFSFLFEFSRIHFAFFDGAHDYGDVKCEISYVVSRQKKGDIIFFDDFQESYFPGIVKAVRELESEGVYSIRKLSINDQRGYAIAERIH